MISELAITGTLNSYMSNLCNIPLLTEEEELELAMRAHHDNDLIAARQLIVSHLRFVVYIAKQYKHYKLPLEDLIQEGNIGLMKAVHRFEPCKGVKLTSFAVHWIRGEINEYVVRNWKIVKPATTKAQRKLFFNLRQMKNNTDFATEKERRAIAKALNVQVEEVREMESRMHTTNPSFDTTDNSTDLLPCDYLTFDDDIQKLIEEEYQLDIKEKIMKFIDELPDRERDIILSRKFMEKPVTMKNLAERYKVSIERVRQIETKIIKGLKKIVSRLIQ